LRQNPNAENIAPLHIDLQGDFFILRGAFPFSMKPYVNAVFLFFTSFKSTTLFHGLLRWCSNQSPGPGAVPSSTWQNPNLPGSAFPGEE